MERTSPLVRHYNNGQWRWCLQVLRWLEWNSRCRLSALITTTTKTACWHLGEQLPFSNLDIHTGIHKHTQTDRRTDCNNDTMLICSSNNNPSEKFQYFYRLTQTAYNKNTLSPYGKIFKILFWKFTWRHRSTLLCWNVLKFVRWEIGEIVHYLPDQKQTTFWLPLKLLLLHQSRPKSAKASLQ